MKSTEIILSDVLLVPNFCMTTHDAASCGLHNLRDTNAYSVTEVFVRCNTIYSLV